VAKRDRYQRLVEMFVWREVVAGLEQVRPGGLGTTRDTGKSKA
jgi:hypothetical protein